MRPILHLGTFLLGAAPAFAQTCPTAAVEHLGGGTPGTLGTPVLGYNGSPIVGNPFALKVTDAPANTAVVFAASAFGTPTPLPTHGAVQHLLPPFFAFELRATDANGVAQGFLGGPPLAPSLCGVEFFAQALVADAGATGFLAFTAGKHLRIGEAAAATPYAGERIVVGSDPRHLVGADLDSDGDLDLVACNFGGTDLSIVLNDGSGGFGVDLRLELAAQPIDCAAFDANEDGVLDLVVVAKPDGAPNTVTFLAGLGDGSFAPGSAITAEPAASSIEVADVDGDGHLDLVVFHYPGPGNDSSFVATYPGNGDGTFGAGVVTPPTGYAIHHAFALGDVTGDGRPDLVASKLGSSNELVVLAGDGVGGFAAFGVVALTAPGTTPVVADFDDDGDLDAAVGGGTSIHLLLNPGAGAFTTPTAYWVGSTPTDLVALDRDGDGDLDLVTVNGSDVVFLHGNGNGGFGYAGASPISGPVRGFVADDLDGDGDVDAAVASGSIAVHLADGAGWSAPGETLLASQRVDHAVVGFFDDDDAADLLTLDTATRRFRVHLADGAGGFVSGPATTVPDNLGKARVGDLDDDGNLDAVVAHLSYGTFDAIVTVEVWWGAGDGSFDGSTVVLASVSGLRDFELGDLDGDGRLDVVATGENVIGQHRMYVRRGAGAQAFEPLQQESSPPGVGGRGFALGDVDGDGLLDAVLEDDDDRVTILLGEGDGTFAPAVELPLAHKVGALTLADADGDGDLDVLLIGGGWGGAVPAWIGVLEGLGGGSFAAPVTQDLGLGDLHPSAAHLVFADVTGDARGDLIVGDGAVLERSGPGPLDLGPVRSFGAWLVDGGTPADLTGDGLPDLLLRGTGSSGVDLRRNRLVEAALD